MNLVLCVALLSQTLTGGLRDALLERFLAPDNPPLVSYEAYRHLVAATRGGRFEGEMDVITRFDAEHGFTFTVLSERGSGLIRRRVLMEALLTEQRTVGSASQGATSLTEANYHFLDASAAAGEPLTTIGVRARRKSPMLVNGTLYLHADRADLVRVEGELAERPSFWTKRVTIVRKYDRVAGVHVPIAMESTADMRIVGDSTFSMTYRYVEVNGVHVEPHR